MSPGLLVFIASAKALGGGILVFGDGDLSDLRSENRSEKDRSGMTDRGMVEGDE